MIERAARRGRALAVMLDGPLFVGLGAEIVEGALVECGDVAYERQPVRFGEPYEDGALVSTDNVEDVLFAAFARDNPPLPFWFVTTVQYGDGEIVASGECDPVVAPAARNSIRFWPGDLTISLEDGE